MRSPAKTKRFLSVRRVSSIASLGNFCSSFSSSTLANRNHPLGEGLRPTREYLYLRIGVIVLEICRLRSSGSVVSLVIPLQSGATPDPTLELV